MVEIMKIFTFGQLPDPYYLREEKFKPLRFC